MRMDPSRGRPASEVLAGLGPAALARLLAENADEPRAAEVAASIARARDRGPLTTTKGLAAAVRAAYPRGAEGEARDATRRVFQAIRIVVNDEFAALDAFLRGLRSSLAPGGRVAILSFHSGEDRRVKSAFKDGLQDGTYASIAPEVVRASPEERRSNPRSTSAKLRFAVRGPLR
jgi:16S rRNA (cytosine1402-N4)-methyltransferase